MWRIITAGRGTPTGILRETAMQAASTLVPRPTEADFDAAMAETLGELAEVGLTSVHSMDTSRGFGSLQRLHANEALKVRVTYNLPLADLHHAERMGVRSGWGDEWLRIWGVKAFLDGSLGSRTAEMLDGSGTARLPQAEQQEERPEQQTGIELRRHGQPQQHPGEQRVAARPGQAADCGQGDRQQVPVDQCRSGHAGR